MRNPDDALMLAWAHYHALLMLAGLMMVLAGAPAISSAWLAALSFAALTYAARSRWTPGGAYGAANAVTVFRLILVCAMLSSWESAPVGAFSFALTALLLDGVDGWLARRYGSHSRYGEFLDKEVDAFLMLALCIALLRSERFGFWIVIPGALRYAFVLFMYYAAPPVKQETATRWSKALGAYALGSLIACLLPLQPFDLWMAVAATTTTLASFASSLWQLYR